MAVEQTDKADYIRNDWLLVRQDRRDEPSDLTGGGAAGREPWIVASWIGVTPADLSCALARLGWTQVMMFAAYSGYDRRTIGRWIRGETNVPLLVERHLDLLLAIRDRLP
ncbi:hypothetical protein [Paraburkholderia pallida]|uniref:Uncharacterized protein n=1 Tax=Paraburkholderia pallida TaxID=2547399 RepID=A0A4P7D9E5_9BURK|nr:hypothetical protein [Paraburkholderia pallida]QBR04067.1 hypothetical protein E1956_43595 [Paraburkholderia pallida]